MVAWGNPDAAMEASPMVLCPPVIPGEVVDAFCKILAEKDPEGKLGEEMVKFIEAEMRAAEILPDLQGVKPGETADEEPTGDEVATDDANTDGPFKV